MDHSQKEQGRPVGLSIFEVFSQVKAMAKTITISILPDGRVQAEVHGVKGKACTDYIGILESLMDAEAIDSAFTPEYSANQNLVGQVDAVESQPVQVRPQA